MATFEERLALIENEQARLKSDNAELKKTIELQTIAIGALVNKAALERLNEKYDRLFDTLISHDRFVNEQLAELRGQQAELDGKVVGLQTEMRQRFDGVDNRLAAIDRRFDGVDSRLAAMDQRFDGVDSRLAAMDQRFSALEQNMSSRFEAQEHRTFVIYLHISLKTSRHVAHIPPCEH